MCLIESQDDPTSKGPEGRQGSDQVDAAHPLLVLFVARAGYPPMHATCWLVFTERRAECLLESQDEPSRGHEGEHEEVRRPARPPPHRLHSTKSCLLTDILELQVSGDATAVRNAGAAGTAGDEVIMMHAPPTYMWQSSMRLLYSRLM